MIDVLLISWMTAIGLLALTPMLWRLGWGATGLALPTGAALYVSVALIMLGIGLPFSTVGALGFATVIAAAVAGSSVRSSAIDVAGFVRVAAVTIGIVALLGLGLHAVHLTRLTTDSVRYLLTASVLETSNSLDLASVWDLRMRHLVTPLLHTAGVAAGGGYSATVTPLFTLSGIITTGWLAWQVFDRNGTSAKTRWWLLGSIGLLIVSANRFGYHAFYVNGHMFFAVFAVIGVGLAALAIATDEWGLLWPASLALAALVPLRPEGLITAAIFLVPAITLERIPYVQRWRILTPVLVAATLWNGVVWPAHAREADLGLLGPVYGNLVVAIGLALGLGLLASRQARVFGRWGPAILAGGLAAFVGVAAAADADLLRSSLAALGANIAVEGLWGTTWWFLPLLIAVAWLVAVSQSVRVTLIPLPVFALAIVAFAYLRGGAYRVGTGDSANRMLLHIAFIAALAVIAAAAEAGGPATQSPEFSGHTRTRESARPRRADLDNPPGGVPT